MVKGEPKLVILLAYQRTGSTFLGNLFQLNPESFYLFEPLDGLYAELYGIPMGWTVPSDISHYANGTKR